MRMGDGSLVWAEASAGLRAAMTTRPDIAIASLSMDAALRCRRAELLSRLPAPGSCSPPSPVPSRC
jgi:hypothetical protein